MGKNTLFLDPELAEPQTEPRSGLVHANFFLCELVAVQKQLKLRWGTAAIGKLTLGNKESHCEAVFIQGV